MAQADLSPEELRERLWKELDEARIVMLGLVGGEPHHMQPMAAFGDKADDAIWFFTRKETDLVQQTGAGHDAMVCIMAKDMEFQACIHGRLVPDTDRAKMDQFWSPFVSAWYPEGKDDPALTMVRLDPIDARVWVSKRGPISYPLQIAKANATHTLPDVGQRGDVSL
jgi:general stress protein 26